MEADRAFLSAFSTAMELALRLVLGALHHHNVFAAWFCHRCERPAACAVQERKAVVGRTHPGHAWAGEHTRSRSTLPHVPRGRGQLAPLSTGQYTAVSFPPFHLHVGRLLQTILEVEVVVEHWLVARASARSAALHPVCDSSGHPPSSPATQLAGAYRFWLVFRRAPGALRRFLLLEGALEEAALGPHRSSSAHPRRVALGPHRRCSATQARSHQFRWWLVSPPLPDVSRAY